MGTRNVELDGNESAASRMDAFTARTMTRRQVMRAGAAAGAVALATRSSSSAWAQDATPSAAATGPAKSIILFWGDGMGRAHRDAGQLVTVGPYDTLVMDSLPVVGLVGTNAVGDSLITDSAAAATAAATGVKTVNGAVGVGPAGERLTNIAELAKASGKSVGIVTTSQVSDASGAAFGAHVESRGDQSEIARQMIEETEADVILGGGEDRWLPEGTPGAHPDNPAEDPAEQSASDKGDLIARAQELGYAYVSDAAGLSSATGPKLLGLFANEEMFQQLPDGEGIYEPIVTLEEMTVKAIEILSENPNGFFLFVEEEAIDEMASEGNSELVIKGVQELDKAVAVGLAYAESTGDTLLIVGADHECGGLTIEAVSDPEELDESGAGGSAAGEADGSTGETLSGEDGPFPIAGTDYQLILDWTTTDHTGTRIPLTAMGPGSERLAGAYENTHIFVAMVEALGLEMPEGVDATPAAGATPVA